MENTNLNIDPIWKRVGFSTAPDSNISGKGIGIILLDEIIPHKSIIHLADRIKQVKVNYDFTVTCTEITSEVPQEISRNTQHGMSVLQLLSHLPFQIDNIIHVGLVPAANFIVLSEVQPEKIKRGLDWILQRRDEWKIRILLNLFVPNTRVIGSMKDTSCDPYVKAMEPAIHSGLMVVAANGNSKAHNNLHPINFFAVGGYDDQGSADFKNHKPHPSVPWGRNGDGHIRPDILAPFTYLPTPSYELNHSPRLLSFFGGSCGAATLVAGVCAHLLSRFPHLDNTGLRSVLIYYGDRMENYDNPAPRINVGKAIEALAEDFDIPELPNYSPPNIVSNIQRSLFSSDPIERALVITEMIEQSKLEREMLWNYLNDDSPIVKKTVISYGLGTPEDERERKLYWSYFYNSERETGEKISWLYQLLSNSNDKELDQWISLLRENDIEITLCVKIFIEKHFKDAPEIEYSPDPNPEIISKSVEPLLKWYKEIKSKD